MNGPGGGTPARRLVVLRHAKSAWPEGVPDHERPLAPRGRRDAPAAGRALAEAGCVPDLALCSTAARARGTWELAAAEWDTPPPVRLDPRLYGADVRELLEVVHETPAVLAWYGTDWRSLAPGTALLTSATVPRGRKPLEG
ncbi:SixA phosphatase family protein [Streptomyces sp. NPDC020377]|uniref:SixA phosphatase family protein n=1 Tax=Streptomyces sp. NPDC020377 TaxID=3365070 RepID=UPI003793AD15